MAEGFHTAEDEDIVRAVVALADKEKDAPRTSEGSLSPAFITYLDQIVRYATGEDKNWDEPHLLLERGMAAWTATAVRKPGDYFVSLKLQRADDWRESRLVLEIVTDDKPFLVDSISGSLTEAGKPVSFFVNAIVDVNRDAKGHRVAQGRGEPVRESMIRAEMDPPVDESEIAELEADIRRVLGSVALAVEDWEPMRARLGSCVAQLERARPAGVEREDMREAIEFLKWLWDNRFAFLGARRYKLVQDGGTQKFERDEDGDLGIARDPESRILVSTYTPEGDLSPAVREFLDSGEPLLIAKANARSTVHRRVHMDYVGVKIFAVDGTVIGEDRFVGLFTADAYNRPATDIPLLRSKVTRVIEGAGFAPGGHNEKALVNILETFPRDEMFQSDIASLRENALGILRLYKRPRTKLFLRRDRFDRFVSALVFIPRDPILDSLEYSLSDRRSPGKSV